MYERKLNLLTYLLYFDDIFSKCHCRVDGKGCGCMGMLQLLCVGGLCLCPYVVRKSPMDCFLSIGLSGYACL